MLGNPNTKPAPASLKPGVVIEAGAARTWPLSVFRGGPAPASFPGRTRPGLIEASTGMQIEGELILFPGRTRPGLIEAGQDGGQWEHWEHDFRGGPAPASLKQG